MTVRQDEVVTVGPGRIGGIELHDPAEEHVAEWCERHRRALVAAVGAQRGVHGKPADHGDRLLVEVGGER